ncbi:MAG: hypothetical protein ACYC3S_17395 [Chloroflexota bacterium]
MARGIEARGLPTVVVGAMRDIMYLNKPPRAAFVDHPLGHPFGRPGDAVGQRAILGAALAVLASAPTSGTLVDLPFAWGEPFSFVPGQRKGPPSGEDE